MKMILFALALFALTSTAWGQRTPYLPVTRTDSPHPTAIKTEIRVTRWYDQSPAINLCIDVSDRMASAGPYNTWRTQVVTERDNEGNEQPITDPQEGTTAWGPMRICLNGLQSFNVRHNRHMVHRTELFFTASSGGGTVQGLIHEVETVANFERIMPPGSDDGFQEVAHSSSRLEFPLGLPRLGKAFRIVVNVEGQPFDHAIAYRRYGPDEFDLYDVSVMTTIAEDGTADILIGADVLSTFVPGDLIELEMWRETRDGETLGDRDVLIIPVH